MFVSIPVRRYEPAPAPKTDKIECTTMNRQCPDGIAEYCLVISESKIEISW